MTHGSPTVDHAPGPTDAALATEVDGTGPRLVLAHGFTQTGRVWGGLDDDLAGERQIVRVDLPGHGQSSGIAASLVDGADLLVAAGGRADYLGYSMGARFCLHAALAHPEAVRSLVLISGTAGLDNLAERAERRAADDALAERLDPSDGSPPADTVPAFVDRWMAAPLFGTIPAERDGREERLTNTGPGLASSLRLAGTGTQAPLWTRMSGLAMPLLVVTGQRDAKFCALGQRLAATWTAPVRHVVIPDTDHAPHLQRPDSVAAAIRQFLVDIDATS